MAAIQNAYRANQKMEPMVQNQYVNHQYGKNFSNYEVRKPRGSFVGPDGYQQFNINNYVYDPYQQQQIMSPPPRDSYYYASSSSSSSSSSDEEEKKRKQRKAMKKLKKASKKSKKQIDYREIIEEQWMIQKMSLDTYHYLINYVDE